MSANRRAFLASTAAVAAGVAAPALAAPAKGAKGSLQDIEHVVILMQENRSFDHYFGTLRGVRGFGDPRAIRLPNGEPVWAQRRMMKDGGEVVLPFRLDSTSTAEECMGSLDHSWRGAYPTWSRYDRWVPAKGAMTMGHLVREDAAYYHALADAFTVGDAYHCSIHGPTNPNRLFLFSGTNGLSVDRVGPVNTTNHQDRNETSDMTKDDPSFVGYDWTPYAHRLEEAGVSWKVYQEYDNYGDNCLTSFPQFRKLDPASSRYRRGRAWAPGSTAENAKTSRGEHLVADFAADVAADRLPKVSWIVAPFHLSEHPDAPPGVGETLTARLVAVLASNPAVWRKTAFILNYDENDGFFDHMPPPVPAIEAEAGASTVSVQGETKDGQPVGLGPRVPLIVISPWTRGGWVNSQVFDHTSVIRLLERRFGVAEPNISPWRRAVCGDLTSVFDFDVPEAARRDVSWAKTLPDTTGYPDYGAACAKPTAHPPATGGMPRQEAGTRPARPLPYDLDVQPSWKDNALALEFVNRGAAGVVFTVYADGPKVGPWSYTVEPGKSLAGTWAATPERQKLYALSVHGPNGFFRRYEGSFEDGSPAEAATAYDRAARRVRLSLSNPGAVPRTVQVAGAPGVPAALTLATGETRGFDWPVRTAADRWYEVTLTAEGGHRRVLAGHVETGEPGISDPQLGLA